jgi:hypothetical protein
MKLRKPTKIFTDFNKRRDPVRSKIVINNNITEQINTSSYQVCCGSYQYEKYITEY